MMKHCCSELFYSFSSYDFLALQWHLDMLIKIETLFCSLLLCNALKAKESILKNLKCLTGERMEERNTVILFKSGEVMR